ncbi:MAG: quinone-dependent dihydroorotate dehydrogenase [Candidatus Paceibacterota bacterium]|jgi:dihydroorotate dehydrogenase
MEAWTKLRNDVIGWNYRNILKPILFKFDPEDIHDLFVKVGNFLGRASLPRYLTGVLFDYENPALEQEILGIKFKNPIGLSAGFDKNAKLTQIISKVGFGFTEIGSVTGRPCKGNEGRHLWRLPKSESLIVYYGLTNDGAENIANRLGATEIGSGYARSNRFRPQGNFVLGVSLAKTNDRETTTTEAGIEDYIKAYEAFLKTEVGDYFTINISCPNTFGGEPFVEPERLDLLLFAFAKVRDGQSGRGLASVKTRPLFVKLPPDLSDEKLDAIIELVKKYKINGFVSTNLTKDRNNPLIKDKIKDPLPTDKGGLSGKIVEELATKQIEYIYKKIKDLPQTERPIIIGCGGIFTAEDAYNKIKAGASLLQLITGMIFEGPQVISEINQGLVALLQKDGYKNISEAVGKNNL